jgi:hypothetical protein
MNRPVHSLHEHRLDADGRDALDRELMVGEMVDGPLGLPVGAVGTDKPTTREHRQIRCRPILR